MSFVSFSSLTPAAQQKEIIKIRKDYAFHQHVIYLIRKDIVAELDKHSKSGMRLFKKFPDLKENFGRDTSGIHPISSQL